MKVTEVEIARVDGEGSLIALASVVLDNQLYVSGISVHRKVIGDGYRFEYPTRGVGNRQYYLVQPLDRSIGREIEQAIAKGLPPSSGGGDA